MAVHEVVQPTSTSTPRKIVLFACWKWGYGAADLAASARKQYSDWVRIVRVRCTGRVDIADILHAIRSGADAVMIVGCKFGECDFETGNHAAKRHVDFAKQVLDRVGVDGARVEMFFCSAAESDKLVAAIREMVRRVEALPPNPLIK